MLSSKHHLTLYTKLMTVLNNVQFQLEATLFVNLLQDKE